MFNNNRDKICKLQEVALKQDKRIRELENIVATHEAFQQKYIQRDLITPRQKTIPIILENGVFLTAKENSPRVSLNAYIPDNDQKIIIPPHSRANIRTGITFRMPKFVSADVKGSSHFALTSGVIVMPTLVTAATTHELKIVVINTSDKEYCVKNKDTIGSLVFSWTDGKKIFPIFAKTNEDIKYIK